MTPAEIRPPHSAVSRAVVGAFSATINIYPSPLPGVAPLQISAPAGTLIVDHVPRARLPWACVIDGRPMRRAYWMQRRCHAGDVIDLHPVVCGGGGGGSRNILAMVATLVIAVAAPYMAAAILGQTAATLTLGGRLLAAGIMMVGSALVNALIPPQMPGLSGGAGNIEQSSTYSVSMSGNQARLGQPIPVGYGRMRSYPDFAAQPYAIFDTAANSHGDQYFYALYAIGHGHYNVEAVMLQDTALQSFRGVQFQILPPGAQPTMVNPAVVSAIEVAGQTLTMEFIGPFSACGPSRTVSEVGIDIICPRGLGQSNDAGTLNFRDIVVRFDFQRIDNADNPLSGWELLGQETISAASATPQRRSYTYAIDPPGRVQVRVRRITEMTSNVRIIDDVTWVGMRGYLDEPAPLAPTVTHLELRMLATEQLSGMSQRRIAVLWHRLVRMWSPDSDWSDLVPTRNPAWALADKWMDSVYGDGLPMDRIDLTSLYHLSLTWEDRQDRFDIIFDGRMDSAAADQIIARAGRAAVFRRNGKRSIVRDQFDDLPVTAYTSRCIRPGSVEIDYLQVTDETADGVVAEYFDRQAWEWREIECPAPGRTYPDPNHPGYDPGLPSMENPVRLRMDGITGPTQAEREGLYMAAANVYRRKYARWQTEMQGVLAPFGATVVFAPALQSVAQSGDVAFWNPATRELGLTEPPAWSAAPGDSHWIALMRRDGSVTPWIEVTPGSDQWSVVIAYEPDFDLLLDDYASERPRYVLRSDSTHKTLVKILAVRPQGRDEDGAPLYEMAAVVDDERVHLVDAHLLPAPGEEQDASDRWGDIPPPPPGIVPLVTLTDRSVTSDYAVDPVGGVRPSVTLRADGTMMTRRYTHADGVIETEVEQQWIATPTPGIGSLYEMRIDTQAAHLPTSEPSIELTWDEGANAMVSNWVPMSADITLFGHYTAPGRITAFFNLTIRVAGTGVEQARARIMLTTRGANEI